MEDEALMRTILEILNNTLKFPKKFLLKHLQLLADIEEPGRMADIIASHLPLKLKEKQEILEILM